MEANAFEVKNPRIGLRMATFLLLAAFGGRFAIGQSTTVHDATALKQPPGLSSKIWSARIALALILC
jgi:hypothetical protein